jgi:hypothetical protein
VHREFCELCGGHVLFFEFLNNNHHSVHREHREEKANMHSRVLRLKCSSYEKNSEFSLI